MYFTHNLHTHTNNRLFVTTSNFLREGFPLTGYYLDDVALAFRDCPHQR